MGVHLEILMVVAVPRVVDSLGYLQPAKEEDELEDEEDGDAYPYFELYLNHI